MRVVSRALVSGVTRVQRDEAIERLKHAIARADGVIVDLAFFGRHAIRLTVELDTGSLSALKRALRDAEVEVLARRALTLVDASKRADPSRPFVVVLRVGFLRPDSNVGVSAHAL